MSKQWNAWPEIEIGGGFCGVMERPGMVLKSISWAVIFAFVWHAGLPLAQAAANGTLSNPPVNESVQQPTQQIVLTEEDEFAETLTEIEAKIAKISAKLSSGEDDAVEQDDLKKLEQKIRKLSAKLESKFMDEENELKAKKLPQVILDRQAAMVQMYQDNLATLLANIQAIGAAVTPAEKKTHADKAKKHLENKKHKRQSDFDPNDLPNKSEQPDKKNKPKESKEEYSASGYISSPMAQIAANGTFTYAQLAGASDPAYLAESTEIKLSPAIIAQAATLNHDPVLIHNWVRNHVEWLPTWGAMQTSDHTLSTLKGNAMDISSLTIALLRASGIPARYAHGTVDVPVAKMMNWAGGFTSDTAVGNHIASGGIPSTGIVRGGAIHHYRMEHVWVQAAVDYYPSRAAKNIDADSWVDMDTSYKQYDYLTGLDLEAIAPFDAYAFTQSYQASTTTDAFGGITGGDPLLIQNAITQRQAAVDAYVQATDPYATVSDVIGGKVIQPFNLPHLASGLPYKLVTRGATYGVLPSQLSFHITFDFQSVDQWGFATGGVPVTLPMADLNNEKVTVSYKPATVADEQTLASYLPTDPYAALPTSLPAYLIQMIPELRVNGQVVMSGSAVQMGTDHKVQYTINYPDGRTRGYSSNFEVGTFHSVGVVGGSVSKERVSGIQARGQALEAALQVGAISNFTTGSFFEDVFYTGTLGYFAMYSGMSRMQAHSSQVEHLIMPSIGSYGTSFKVGYFFGFPRNVTMAGTVMDIGKLVTVTTAKSGSSDERISLARNTGLLSSALEHAIPEMLFSDPLQPAQAVSAVKLLQTATQQGMPIYQINQNNQAAMLPQLQLSADAMSEIQTALATGKEVTAHQSNITTSFGWTGAGYVIFDPVSGDGVYRITGGLNGGASTGPETLLLSAITGFVDALNKVNSRDGKNLLKIAKGLSFIAAPLALLLTLGQVAEGNMNNANLQPWQGWAEAGIWVGLSAIHYFGAAALGAFLGGGLIAALLVGLISVIITYFVIEFINSVIYGIARGNRGIRPLYRVVYA